MCAGLGLCQVVARAPRDDLNLVVDVVLQHLAQAQLLGHAVDERQVVAAERGLQRGVLVEVVEHDLGHGGVLELDNET